MKKKMIHGQILMVAVLYVVKLVAEENQFIPIGIDDTAQVILREVIIVAIQIAQIKFLMIVIADTAPSTDKKLRGGESLPFFSYLILSSKYGTASSKLTP